jgi:hypothetical protein
MAPKRVAGLAAVLARAVIAGTIASSNGNASAVPTPLRTVRREMAFFAMIMKLFS